jgi:DNA topoisomerase-1
MNPTVNLIIVESPSKCKKIQSYLGKGYKVIATCGHFRTIPALTNINLETFKIKYEVTKPKVVALLKKEIAEAKEVFLATDDDREGETIAWHVCKVCKLPKDTKRILFHEVTERDICRAMSEPTVLRMNLVYSQIARQVLDVYIGFTVSPMLWKYVGHTLSAGRCQTPTLRLVADREREIENTIRANTFVVKGYFTNERILFHFSRSLSQEETPAFLEALRDYNFVLSPPDAKEVSVSPPKILTTSTLQQANLSMTPQQIMKCAQTLYEEGYITYLRTDNAAYSEDFLRDAATFLKEDYEHPLQSQKQTTGAHEGIRATQLSVSETKIDPSTDKLYKYIYQRTLQSCMKPARMLHTTFKIQMKDDYFYYTSVRTIDPGWKQETETQDWLNYLNYLTTLHCKRVVVEETPHFLTHWTEGHLISELEKRSIGRPSTYSHLLDTVQDRKYVVKGKITRPPLSLQTYEFINEGNPKIITCTKEVEQEETNRLSVTPLGRKVEAFCTTYYDSLFNYDYTRMLEANLDLVEEGSKDWTEVVKECMTQLSSIVIDMPLKKYESLHVGLHEKTPLLIKHGTHGFYLEHKGQKRSLQSYEKIDFVEQWITEQAVPPEEMEGLIAFLKTDNTLLVITDSWSVRTGPHGRYLFFKAKTMKKPKFYPFPAEHENSTPEEIEAYIRKKYKTI